MYANFVMDETCALTNRNIRSLEFTVNRVLMKVFKTSNLEIISKCRDFFGIELPSLQLVERFEKFSCSVSLLVD